MATFTSTDDIEPRLIRIISLFKARFAANTTRIVQQKLSDMNLKHIVRTFDNISPYLKLLVLDNSLTMLFLEWRQI